MTKGIICDSEMFNHDLLEACIRRINDEMERVMWNVCQEEYNSPIYNYGGQFHTAKFKIRSYDWNWDFDESTDALPEPNFEWRDYKLWWYKHLGRGDYANREISNDELAEMCRECRDEVARIENTLMEHQDLFRSEDWKRGYKIIYDENGKTIPDPDWGIKADPMEFKDDDEGIYIC